MRNYYPNRFRNLEYKFMKEEIKEKSDTSFVYYATAYVAGIENEERSEMKVSYEMEIVKEDQLFKIAEQKQYVE
ncbi:putative transcriptional regulator, Bla/Mec [Bacillus clarus]|uniref:Putative transcriptional regulator, Bla/Mec n=1 Tax=Bacillus clarus TaxID=2338372 RepID=A0A090YWA0_9BACI|nr:hypothetical protein [Bacillus clarus]KFN03149.1 putative transcriptional regulator, Bla/Mec [Bacillus clarus]